MAEPKVWADKRSELNLLLQRSFWKPLRNTIEIFHVLPLVAVVMLFVLLATNGQFREIYISYLERTSDNLAARAMFIVAALATIALISAVLYQVHNALSTMRINVVFSSHADPAAGSKLRRLQRAAAFVVAFMPWLGLTIGLFGARNFVADRYCQLLNVAHVPADALQQMQFLPDVSGMQIAAAVIVLGAVIAFFVSIDDRNRVAQCAVACVAPALAALLLVLFTDQLNPKTWISWPAWKMFVAVAIVTVIYFLIYHRLYHRRAGFLLSRVFTRTGISFRRRRRRRLALWAFLPWLAFALYFCFVEVFFPPAATAPVEGRDLSSRQTQYVVKDTGIGQPINSEECSETADGVARESKGAKSCPSSNNCPNPFISTVTVPVPGRWAIFPVAMCCTIAIGLLVGHFLLRLGSSKRHQAAVGFVVCGLALAVALLSVHNDADLIVSVYRFIGPLATVSLELLFLISTFAVLALLSQYSGFPALTLIVLTVVVCVIFPNYAGLAAVALGLAYFGVAVVAFVSGRIMAGVGLLLLVFVGWINVSKFTEGSMVPPNTDKAAATKASVLNVRTAYLCWLDQKGIPVIRMEEQQSSCGARPEHPPAVNGTYPVFIVAAEGGGIYAASAAATFLARLEDLELGFAQHIFAISGVSGGSIGAAVFQALDHARHPDPTFVTGALANDDAPKGREDSQKGVEEKCPQQSAAKAGRDLTAKVANIMQDDHFSPVIGSIFPEIFNAPLQRPDALRASFEYSASAQDPAAGQDLRARFLQHWSAAGAAPALILNSTWVETGFRVAFAPFRLHDLDESLYSFLDTSMPNEDCPKERDPQSCVSLMTAAGVSARFPGIMPPFSVTLNEGKRWNFVDGGYSDNSGATTALDVYLALKDAVPPTDVDLRLVLITSSNPQPNLGDQSINGTIFRDTIAPIDAILKVREDLANDAVAHACSVIYPDTTRRGERCVDHRDGKLQIVEIQDQTYGLPLGWKISQTSFRVVSWMLGQEPTRPSAKDTVTKYKVEQDQTPAQNGDAPNAQLKEITLERNSRVSCLLLDLVRKSSVSR